jgi:hypothetical protein
VKEGCVILDIDPSDTDRRCKEAFEAFRADKEILRKKTRKVQFIQEAIKRKGCESSHEQLYNVYVDIFPVKNNTQM